MSEIIKPAVEIVRASPDDAATICDIRDRAWLEAYPNPALGFSMEDIRVNAQGRNGEFVPRRIAYLQEQFSLDIDTALTTYVAKVDGVVAGYVEPKLDERGRRCISAIYVAPETQGMGVGGKLLRHALSMFGRDQDIYLEVVAYNHRAIAFYENFGFEKTDAVVPKEESRPDYMKSLPQVEMVLKAIK